MRWNDFMKKWNIVIFTYFLSVFFYLLYKLQYYPRDYSISLFEIYDVFFFAYLLILLFVIFKKTNTKWVIISIFFFYILFANLPLLNNYIYFNESDYPSHYGLILDAQKNFKINDYLVYPSMHILTNMTFLIFGNFLSPKGVIVFSNVFGIVYYLIMLVFIRKNKNDFNKYFILFLFLPFLILKISFVPAFFSLSILVTLWYIVQYKIKLRRMNILLLLLLIGLIPSHFEVALFTFVALIIYYLFNRNNNILYLVIIAFIVYIIYILQFQTIESLIIEIFGTFFNISKTHVGQYSSVLTESTEKYSLFYIAFQLLLNLGDILFLLLGIALLNFFIFKKKLYNKKLLLYDGLVLLFGLLYIITLFFNLKVDQFRMLKYIIFFSFILIVMFYFKLGKEKKYLNYLFIIAIIIAMINIYPTPVIKKWNNEIIDQNVQSTEYLINNINNSAKVFARSAHINRYITTIYGDEKVWEYRILWEDNYIPDHINISSLESGSYLFINDLDFLIYIHVFPEFNKIVEEDEIDINFQEEIIKVYSNGFTRNYFIQR